MENNNDNTKLVIAPKTTDNKSLITLNEIKEIARYWAGSKFNAGLTEQQAVMLLLIAQSENLHPMQAMAQYDIINGRPALKSQAMLARFNMAGGKIKWSVHNDKIATCIVQHPNGGDPFEVTWTIERAQKANLTHKDNWKNHPAQMLRARAQSEAIRAIAPEYLNGLYTKEEVQDFALEKDQYTVKEDVKSESNKELSEPKKAQNVIEIVRKEASLIEDSPIEGEFVCLFGEHKDKRIKDIPNLITFCKTLKEKSSLNNLELEFLNKARVFCQKNTNRKLGVIKNQLDGNSPND